MRLNRGKYILAAVLVLALLLNPVVGMAGAVSASAGGSAPGAAAFGSPFRQSASLLGSMFNNNSQTLAGSEAESEESGESLLSPLLDVIGEFVELFLEDEKLKEVLGEVLDEVLDDERIADYDLEGLVVGTLRDDRLVEILGSVIADHLREEDFLYFVEQLTFDLAALLQDPAIESYLQKVVVSLLEDDRINEFVFDIIYFVLANVEQFIDNLGEGELLDAIIGFAEEIIAIFEEPITKFAEGLKDDRRVTGYVDGVQDSLGLDEWADLGGWFVDRLGDSLEKDAQFEEALAELKLLLLGPEEATPEDYSGLISRIATLLVDYILEQEALLNIIEPLLDELTDIGEIPENIDDYDGAYTELFAVLFKMIDELEDGLLGDDGAVTAIGAEFASIMDHYSEYAPFPDKGDPEGCMEDIQGEVTNQDEVEDHVADFLNYWAEVAAWAAGKKIERGDLDPLIEKFFTGEEAHYLDDILEAVLASVDDLKEELLGTEEDPGRIKEVLERHLEGFIDDLEIYLENLLEDDDGFLDGVASEMEEIIGEKLEQMIESGVLSELLEGKGETFLEVLLNLITALLDDLPDLGLGDGVDGAGLQAILDDIALELPFAALTDLIDVGEVKKLTGELGALIDSLPLDSVAPFVRNNADELGYTIAETLLNGLADGVADPEPEDPRVAAVMELLLTEDRLRELYLDMGGADPDKITAESGVLTVILAVLLEVAGDEERIEHFREELAGESEPVRENLLNYGNRISDWILGSLLSFAEPFIKRGLASFLIFTPRGYGDELEGDLAELITYERFSEDAAEGRQLAGEFLTESMAGRFVDESMSRFLVEHRAVEDFATPQRLGVLQHFIAELADEEQLKAVNAEIGAEQLFEAVGSTLPRIQREALPTLIKPDSLTRDLNTTISDLLPTSPIHLSLETFSLSAGELLKKVTGFIDEKLPVLREGVDEMAGPVGNIPAELLDDAAIRKAKDEILAGVPEPALDLVAEILDDQRLEELLSDLIGTVIEEVLADGGIVEQTFDLADSIFRDAELNKIVEDAIVMLLTGNDLPALLGELVGDLLEDEELLSFVENLLDVSRMIAVGGYSCPPGTTYYKPGNFLGSVNGEYPAHGFEGEADLPDAFIFETKIVNIELLSLELIEVKADDYFFEMGCNNGLYMFTQELLNWMDPDKPFDAAYPTPGEYLRNYLPDTYLEKDRVRTNLAQPVAALITGTVAGTVGDLSEERGWIEKFIMEGEGLPLEPLSLLAQFLREEGSLPGIIGSCLKAFEEPYDHMVNVLKDNAEIEGLLQEGFDILPLEEGADYLRNNRALRGLLDDAGIDIGLSPLRPFLKIDREVPLTILRRVQTFPVSRVTNFLTTNERLYRTTYLIEDVKARFIGELMTNPDLIELESDLVREKVQEANYSLAEGVFNVAEKFVNQEDLIDYLGNLIFDFAAEQFKRAKGFFRFIFGLPGDVTEKVLSPAPPEGTGFGRGGGVLWTKEVV